MEEKSFLKIISNIDLIKNSINSTLDEISSIESIVDDKIKQRYSKLDSLDKQIQEKYKIFNDTSSKNSGLSVDIKKKELLLSDLNAKLALIKLDEDKIPKLRKEIEQLELEMSKNKP